MKNKILVIEDDLFFQQMLKDLLSLEGYEIFLANNGIKGMQLFHKVHPDLVITDIIMPEKEGTETIIELKQIKPDVKIIAMSGGGRGGFLDYLETANEFGVDATFPKPFNNKYFLNKVHEILR
ncbi:MAG: response regulator [Bacteroidetes bacterium]|jgi:DNA-binding response OmpR family regulator|nr:response regulator [Bacteroidota bacterium]